MNCLDKNVWLPKLLFLFLIWFYFLACQPESTINVSSLELKKHLSFLSSDFLSGRLSGEIGCMLAEKYIANFFYQNNFLTLTNLDNYFHPFEIFELEFEKTASFLKIEYNNNYYQFEWGIEYLPFSIKGDGEIEGELVFAGYGIKAPELNYNDYKNLDVRNKIVLIWRGEPQLINEKFRGEEAYSKHSYLINKVGLAAEMGARAVIFLPAPLSEDNNLKIITEIKTHSFAAETCSADNLKIFVIPTLMLTEKAATNLWKFLLLDEKTITSFLEKNKLPAFLKIPKAYIHLRLKIAENPIRKKMRNIAALKPALNPAIPGRFIVICAHHDHLGRGYGSNDVIFNGADDNASGVAVLLSLAKRFQTQSVSRHGLIFLTFSAEELGLLGSDAFISQPPFDLKRISYVVNLDMLSRNSFSPLEVRIRTQDRYKISPLLSYLIKQKILVDVVSQDYTDRLSDDYSFGKAGITTFSFFSGLHPDYHTVEDEIEKIDFSVLAQRFEIIYDFLKYLDKF